MTPPENRSQPADENGGLTPEQERIVRRIRSLAMISAGVMGLAVLLVLSAIVYRVVKPQAPEEAADADAVMRSGAVEMPAGGRVTETRIDGRRLVITIEHAGGTRIVVFDVIDWKVAGTVDLQPRQ